MQSTPPESTADVSPRGSRQATPFPTHGASSASTIPRSATATMVPSPMRPLNLPGLTELVTSTGKKQLYTIDPDELGRYLVNFSDLTAMRRKFEEMLGDPAGKIQVSVKTDIANMKSNTQAQHETSIIVDNIMKTIATDLPTVVRHMIGDAGVRMAPTFAGHFKLFLPDVATTPKSAAHKQLVESLHLLAPIYKKLETTAASTQHLKDKSSDLQTKLADCETKLQFIDENTVVVRQSASTFHSAIRELARDSFVTHS